MADGLTDLQRRFVEEYARNGFTNAADAARKAGYTENTAENAYRAILGSATVREEVNRLKEGLRAELRDRLVGEASKSLEVVREIRDEGTDERARLAAAKDLLDRADLVGEKTNEPWTIVIERAARKRDDEPASDSQDA
jgi:phage terminase small subunit